MKDSMTMLDIFSWFFCYFEMIFLGKGFVDNNFVSDISKLDPIMPIPYNFI